MRNSILPALLLLSVLKSMTGADEVLYAQVGETVTLEPPKEYNPTAHYLYWYFGDLELAWRNPQGGSDINGGQDMAKWKDKLSLSGSSLIIKKIPEEQFGTFTCKTKPARDKIEKSYKLLKVQVSMNPASPLLPGDSLSLTCEADRPHSLKEPKIRWLNPQGDRVNNNVQHIVTATRQHNGEWTCVVTNDNKEKRSTITVTVVDLSPAPALPLYTSKFQSLTIPCSIPSDVSWEQVKAKGVQGVHWDYLSLGSSHISGDPQRLFSLSLNDTLSWQPDKNRGLTPVSSLMKGNLSLFINKAKVEDRGDYVCTMKFHSGLTLNRTVQVNVLQITSSPGTDLISGQQLNLTCSLGRPLSSDLQLKLIPPKQSYLQPLTSDHEPALLNIPEVGTGDGGRWKCELWQHSTLLTFVEITLKIEPKLSVWMLIIICSVTVIVLLVLVLVFILCHRRQRKMRHLRHRLCHCKNPKPKGFYRT